MKALNISLTEDQYRFIRERTKKDGFANVSEYMRAIVRFLQSFKASPQVHLTLEDTPKNLTPDKIASSLKAHGYNEQFIKSVAKGFSKSEFYKRNHK